MIKFSLSFSVIVFTLSLNAQQTGRMETDRPDQTECPFIVKHKWVQAETGFNFEDEGGLNTWVHPTILWKYGASKKFEFRLITEMNSAQISFMPSGKSYETGLLPVQIGGKLAFCEEKGLLPKTSLIFHLAVPKLASKNFRYNNWAPNFRFTMQHTIEDGIGLGYNLGAEWDGFSSTPWWIYTIAPGFNLGEKWYGYIEAYGGVRQGDKPRHGIDGGLAYYVNDNLKLDISGGINIINSPNYVALGCSFRFNTGKKSK